jgi:hypothetical protein
MTAERAEGRKAGVKQATKLGGPWGRPDGRHPQHKTRRCLEKGEAGALEPLVSEQRSA